MLRRNVMGDQEDRLGGGGTSLVAWLAEHVTSDPRALAWFDEPGCEDRIIRGYRELLAGYEIDPKTLLKTTRVLDPGEVAGIVEVKDITFFSICAHHFLPFFGTASVAYIPGERIIGLGKLPRIVDAHARRFRIQEDLTRDIAQLFMEHAGAKGSRVITEAAHLCMCGRGPSQPSSRTRVEVRLGDFPT
ncbi:MAG: GTP cyclohydrolase I [Myxococcales bacterium]|nr:GTP cyclohydrolase I [Myxococcales bacterium]